MTGLEQQLARLMSMSPAQLRLLWRDTYRSPAPDIGPDLLRRGIANRLQERIHGKLPNAAKREIDRLRKGLRGEDSIAGCCQSMGCAQPPASFRSTVPLRNRG